MESLRDEPEEKLDFSALTIEHVFTNFQQEEWDEDFPIDSSVTEISVYFTTSFVGDDVVPDDWDARYAMSPCMIPMVKWSGQRKERKGGPIFRRILNHKRMENSYPAIGM